MSILSVTTLGRSASSSKGTPCCCRFSAHLSSTLKVCLQILLKVETIWWQIQLPPFSPTTWPDLICERTLLTFLQSAFKSYMPSIWSSKSYKISSSEAVNLISSSSTNMKAIVFRQQHNMHRAIYWYEKLSYDIFERIQQRLMSSAFDQWKMSCSASTLRARPYFSPSVRTVQHILRSTQRRLLSKVTHPQNQANPTTKCYRAASGESSMTLSIEALTLPY